MRRSMLAGTLVAAGLCAAAFAVATAQDPPIDVPLVLGGDAVEQEPPPSSPPAEAGSGGPDASASIAPESVLVEESPDAAVPFGPGVVSSCIDEAGGTTAFTTFDLLFLERANTAGPLAVQSQSAADPGATVLAASDLRYPVFPGVRVFSGRRLAESAGWEVGYLGVWSMHADAQAVSPAGTLALPGALGLVAGSGLDAATIIRPSVDGSLNSAEFNVFATRVHGGCRRHEALPWRRSWDVLEGSTATVDWLLGVRWAGLDETANLAVTAATPTPSTTAYRVTTSSQLVGPQIGHRRRVAWDDWAVEGWLKAAVVGSILSQSQGAVVGPFDLVPIRGPLSSSAAGVGMIGDVGATAVRRLGDHWALRAGYTLLWFSGVAPAANQWDFTDTTASGTRVAAGTVFLHGATLGLEAAW